MEDLELSNWQESIVVSTSVDGVVIRISPDVGHASFDKDQARQLHEWLGRYLENSDE